MIKKGVVSAIVFLLCLNISFALVGHPASQIFNTESFTGDQIFDNNLIVNGNIGIGTANPTDNLDVNGTINIETGNSLTFGSAVAFQREDSPARLKVGQGFNIIELDGNVGIGTSSPNKLVWSKALTINSVAGNSAFEVARGDSVLGFFGNDAGNITIGSHIPNYLLLRTNNQDRVTITSTGNVGIGTTLPSAKLDVNGDMLVDNINGGTPITSANIGSQSVNYANNAGTIGGYSASQILQMQGATILNSGHNLDSLNDGWYSWTSSTPVNAPDSYMILVQKHDGAQKIQIAFGGAGSGKIYVRRADSGTFYSWTEFLQTNQDYGRSGVSNYLYMGSDTHFYRDAANRIRTPDDFYVDTNSGSTYLYSTNTYLGASSGDTTLLRGNTLTWNQGVIQGNGYVGIGTTNPATTLDVNGPVKLGNYATKPTCNSGLRGSLVYDTSNAKPYVCNGATWKPLDSDYDSDGLTDAVDVNDYDASGGNGLSNLIASNIKEGVVINGITGTHTGGTDYCAGKILDYTYYSGTGCTGNVYISKPATPEYEDYYVNGCTGYTSCDTEPRVSTGNSVQITRRSYRDLSGNCFDGSSVVVVYTTTPLAVETC